MPPSPSPRPEIDVWFQTAGRGTAFPLSGHRPSLKIYIFTSSSIYARGRAARETCEEPARAARAILG